MRNKRRDSSALDHDDEREHQQYTRPPPLCTMNHTHHLAPSTAPDAVADDARPWTTMVSSSSFAVADTR